MKLVIFLGVIAVILFYFITLYNALVNLKLLPSSVGRCAVPLPWS